MKRAGRNIICGKQSLEYLKKGNKMMKRQVAVISGKGEVKMILEKLPDLKEHEVRGKTIFNSRMFDVHERGCLIKG